MVWQWLKRAGVGLAKFLLPHTPPRMRIDPNAPCPACGYRTGSIRTVRFEDKVMVKHTCHQCECAWLESPLSQPDYPAI